MQIFTQILVLLTVSLTIAAPLRARDSSEALGNIQYLSGEWESYTASLHNISKTYGNKRHFNASTLPLQVRYAIIALESSYNMNFEYESYPIQRIAAGPPLNKTVSEEVVHATKVLLHDLTPLFHAFKPFRDIIGKDNAKLMLSFQSSISDLIVAVTGVVVPAKVDDMQKLGKKHDTIVAALEADVATW